MNLNNEPDTLALLFMRQCKNIDYKFDIRLHQVRHVIVQHQNDIFRGFIKRRAPGKLTGSEWDLAINLPGCFRLLFLPSFIRKTKYPRLKNCTDLLHKNLMKPLHFTLVSTGHLFSSTNICLPWILIYELILNAFLWGDLDQDSLAKEPVNPPWARIHQLILMCHD